MSAASFDPADLPSSLLGNSSSRAEIDRWLQTMESLLSDVADDPELAEPLARIIARTRERHEAASERTKQAFSSIESLIRNTKPPAADNSSQSSTRKVPPRSSR
jgi:uncharacterized membrane protein YccC